MDSTNNEAVEERKMLRVIARGLRFKAQVAISL